MDEKLRRVLERIARDKTSGASQLARIVCAALRQRFANSPSPRTAELRTAARLLLSAQPEMAPVARLAIECRRAANSAAAFGRFPEVVAAFEAQLTTAPTTIAAHFESLLSGHRSIRVAMFSYSGTAIGAVVRARRRIRGVFCAEGRPNFEGRRAARELSLAGLRVTLLTDPAWLDSLGKAAMVVVGADAVTESAFLNKVGTSAAVCSARRLRIPVYVLADSTKFLPSTAARRLLKVRNQAGPISEVWSGAPLRVHIENPYLAWTSWQEGVHWLSEAGIKRATRSRQLSYQVFR